MRRLMFPILVMVVGGLCMLGGVLLTAAQVFQPQQVENLLPATPTLEPPTPALLFRTPLAPPPPAVGASVPIMPVMAAEVQESTALPPTLTVSPTNTSTGTPTQTIVAAQPTEQGVPESTIPPTPIPFVTLTPTVQATSTTTPSPTATRQPRQPDRLLIPSIELDATITPVWLQQVVIDGDVYSQWQVPGGVAVGWHETSASLGQVGNTVLNGHHNLEGHVFRDLIDVEPGDTIRIEASDGFGINYTVVQSMLLQEENVSIDQRLENARWLLPSHDERITLVTCWPPDGRSHRLVVIALPSDQLLEGETQ
jgi:LPXTG-site transpeptidase (sortase) family protein